MATLPEPIRISRFLGLASPGSTPPSPQLTRDMVNLILKDGILIPRPGSDKLGAASAEFITHLFDYDKDGTITLMRVRKTTVEQWNTGTSTWDNVTVDVGFTGAIDDFPSHNVFKSNLYLITKPDTKPYKKIGTGDILQIAAAPTARVVVSFFGFLFLAYIDSTNPRQVRYSTGGSAWSVVDVLNMEDTPREIIHMMPLDTSLHVYKPTAIERIRHVGSSSVTFNQGTTSASVGLGAVNTLMNIPGIGHIFMGNDGRLFLNNGTVTALRNNINEIIASELNYANMSSSFAGLDFTRNTYSLWYPIGTSTDSTRRLDLNYQTGEVTPHNYEFLGTGSFHRGFYTKALRMRPSLVVSEGSQNATPFTFELRQEFDATLKDDGGVIYSYWTTDWMPLHSIDAMEVQLMIKHRGIGSVRIFVAEQFATMFHEVKRVELARRVPGDEIISYQLDFGGKPHGWVKIRIEPDTVNQPNDVQILELHLIPKESIETSAAAGRP